MGPQGRNRGAGGLQVSVLRNGGRGGHCPSVAAAGEDVVPRNRRPVGRKLVHADVRTHAALQPDGAALEEPRARKLPRPRDPQLQERPQLGSDVRRSDQRRTPPLRRLRTGHDACRRRHGGLLHPAKRVALPWARSPAATARPGAHGLRSDHEENRALRWRRPRPPLRRYLGVRLREPHLGAAQAETLAIAALRPCAAAPSPERQDRSARRHRLYIEHVLPSEALSPASLRNLDLRRPRG